MWRSGVNLFCCPFRRSGLRLKDFIVEALEWREVALIVGVATCCHLTLCWLESLGRHRSLGLVPLIRLS